MTKNNASNQNLEADLQNEFQKSDNNNLSKSSPQIPSKDLLTRLKEATKDLFYISETDAPFEAFVWQREADTEALSNVNVADILRFSEKAPDTPSQEQSLDDFFHFPTAEQDWQSDDEKEIVKRYVKLKELISRELHNPKVVKIGEVEIDVYIAGIDGNGNLAGVKTEAVET